jgi:1-acyl-sn-glycerol-3-phosphate acyltransferase
MPAGERRSTAAARVAGFLGRGRPGTRAAMTRPRRTKLGDILWAPYSLAVWATSFAWMVTLTGLSLPLTLVIPFARLQRFGPAYSLGWIPRLTLSRLRVHFDAGYDRDRTSIYCQNHVSVLDGPIALGALPVSFCGIQKASYLKIPGYGWLMRLGNAIGVPPAGAPKRYENVAAACRERASRDISVLVFPEAHRTLDGQVREFRRGIFEIAVASGLPVVPVAVRGMFEILPKGTWITRPGRIDVYVGPQIDTEGLDDDGIDALMDRVHAAMSAFVAEGRLVDGRTLPLGASVAT